MIDALEKQGVLQEIQMERKRRMRKFGLVFILLGTAAAGALLGAVVFLTEPDLIPLPTPATEAPATVPPRPTETPAPEWVMTFEYRLSSGPLDTGRHSYELSADCTGAPANTWNGSFEVSGAAELLRDRAYMRPGGIMDDPVGGNRLVRVHPDQSLGAALTFTYSSLDAAEAARAGCRATFSLDGKAEGVLEPRLPREQSGA